MALSSVRPILSAAARAPPPPKPPTPHLPSRAGFQTASPLASRYCPLSSSDYSVNILRGCFSICFMLFRPFSVPCTYLQPCLSLSRCSKHGCGIHGADTLPHLKAGGLGCLCPRVRLAAGSGCWPAPPPGVIFDFGLLVFCGGYLQKSWETQLRVHCSWEDLFASPRAWVPPP